MWKALLATLTLLLPSLAWGYEKPGSMYSPRMIEWAQTMIDDPVTYPQADTAWNDEILPEITGCVGHVPNCNAVMTPDSSHDDYVAQCPNCTGGSGDCCQLSMRAGSNPYCPVGGTPASPASCGPDEGSAPGDDCEIGGGTNPECDRLEATEARRSILDDDAECAMWLALGWAINRDLGVTPRADYAEDAADIINDWTYQMLSAEIRLDTQNSTQGNEGALNTISRLGGLPIAADLIWDSGALSAADKTQFQSWMQNVFQFAAQDRATEDVYGNQAAVGRWAGFMTAHALDDPDLMDVWLNGGATGLGDVNGEGTTIIGFYEYLDDAICPQAVPGETAECDLDRLADHNSGTGEIWDDADRNSESKGTGSWGAFYSHKHGQALMAALEVLLNTEHLNLFRYAAADGSSPYEAMKFLYNGTKMVCPDKFSSGGPPQTSGNPDGLCDHDGASVVNFCTDDFDNCTSCTQTSGNPDGLCDWDGVTTSFCSDTLSPADTGPGFWGDQDSPICVGWRDLQASNAPRGSLMRAGWPFLARYVARLVYNEPTWAHADDVDFPIDATTRVDDGHFRAPEVVMPTFGRFSQEGFNNCFWEGPGSQVGGLECFNGCCQRTVISVGPSFCSSRSPADDVCLDFEGGKNSCAAVTPAGTVLDGTPDCDNVDSPAPLNNSYSLSLIPDTTPDLVTWAVTCLAGDSTCEARARLKIQNYADAGSAAPLFGFGNGTTNQCWVEMAVNGKFRVNVVGGSAGLLKDFGDPFSDTEEKYLCLTYDPSAGTCKGEIDAATGTICAGAQGTTTRTGTLGTAATTIFFADSSNSLERVDIIFDDVHYNQDGVF